MSALRTVAVMGLVGGGAYLVYRAVAGGGQGSTFDFSGLDFSSFVDPPVDLTTGGANPIESYLLTSGLTSDQAKGVAAGIYAESGSNPNAINPTSGAYGIGQWLGSRKAALFARYGSNPDLFQQLEFLVWELGGGDAGGSAVLAQTSASDTLSAYIKNFMRPGPGTSGDLSRGAKYLG